jgi:Protein of unknown function (DUF2934)
MAAETTKAAKAPTKPRKTATKKSTEVEVQKKNPSSSEIAELARKFWADRGYQDGYAEQDWLRAEQELQNS